MAAIRVLRALQDSRQPATRREQDVLARWSGWGAVPGIFDELNPEFAAERVELQGLLSSPEWNAARRTTINAHYTDPRIAEAVWKAVRPAVTWGVGARVLEPGCGSGTFIGLAPFPARVTGVELDPTTAAIAAALNPHAEIRAESFADTRLPDAHFDLVVGNVPFADVVLHDRTHNAGRFPMHDHFIVKSLALTRSGGYVGLLTSRFTLDKRDPAAREMMAGMADLVGVARLPVGAHWRTAGTDVITDVVVFRRRGPKEEPGGHSFTGTREVTVPGPEGAPGLVRINEVYAEHPDHVLGELSVARGQYATADLQVTGDLDQLGRRLQSVLLTDQPAPQELMPTKALSPQRRPAIDHADDNAAPEPVAAVDDRPDPGGLPDGFLESTPEFTFTRIQTGVRVPLAVPGTQAAELRSLLRIRDTYLRLVSAEAVAVAETEAMVGDRAALNRVNDRHVAAYGALSAVTMTRTGRVDADGDPIYSSRRRPQGGFRTDPYAPVVLALEHYDPSTGTAGKADIFRVRILTPRQPRTGADTPADAVAICVDSYARVDLPHITGLLGRTDEPAVLGELVAEGLLFEDPGPAPGSDAPRPVTRAEYLSGNVREKLRAAIGAAVAEPGRYARNVEALSAVIPAELGPDDIEVRLGGWIGHTDVQTFLRETLGSQLYTVTNPGGGLWEVKGPGHGILATDTWGTQEYPTPKLAQALLRQSQIQVTRSVDDHDVVDVVATEAAVRKGEELNERFGEWVWEDAERSRRLAADYNERFNAIVLRSYDNTPLSLPGLAASFTPRPHQVAAVARIINEPAVGLFHVVGAGKTAEMAMGVMELRRLGMVRKPAVIVPNHLVGQFTAEFVRAYPAAKVLAASLDEMGTGDKRRGFLGRVANNDWDAVVFSRESFKKIPVSAAAERAYMDQESAQLRTWIDNGRAQGAGYGTIKSLEKKLLRCEARLTERLDITQDTALTFEQSGIDYLVVDEAHDYKNLRTPSNNTDLAIDGSQRSDDLLLKLTYLRATHGHRVATFATGTPVANSMTELHVMQRYLRPDLLADAGLDTFDEWVATFAQEHTGVEVKPTGGGFRVKSRVSKFRNIPELMRMVHVFGDVKMAEDLDLPRPSVIGGQAELVVIPPTPELEAINADIADRVERTGGRGEGQDNILALMNVARTASLDTRLQGEEPSGPVKIDVAADRITDIWREHAEVRYGDSPVPGALQIVFADLGVPHPPPRGADEARWNVYAGLRGELVARGMPAHAIAFVHDAGNDREKAALFDRCRSGQVAVLIGSTQKMGTGTNVQHRAVALHHLDPSWRPSDIEQREGRIIRQGNQNTHVRILAYATEGSFDAYMWQTVERKAKFIGQVMRGKLDVREIEDVGDPALTAGQFKAITAGDPLLMEQAEVDAEVQRLTRLQRNHDRTQKRLGSDVTFTRARIAALNAEERQLTAAIDRSTPTRGDAFTAHIRGRTLTRRPDATGAIAEATRGHLRQLEYHQRTDPQPLGTIGGQTITVQARKVALDVTVTYTLRDVPGSSFEVKTSVLDGPGVLSTLENRAAAVHTDLERTRQSRTALHEELARLEPAIGAPFTYATDLTEARGRANSVAGQLAAEANKRAAAPAEADNSEEHAGEVPTRAGTAPAVRVPDEPAAGYPAADQDAPGEQPRRPLARFDDEWLSRRHQLLDRLLRTERAAEEAERLGRDRDQVLAEIGARQQVERPATCAEDTRMVRQPPVEERDR